jgi:hypothetical protein
MPMRLPMRRSGRAVTPTGTGTGTGAGEGP